jgi:hypothetical protein
MGELVVRAQHLGWPAAAGQLVGQGRPRRKRVDPLRLRGRQLGGIKVVLTYECTSIPPQVDPDGATVRR